MCWEWVGLRRLSRTLGAKYLKLSGTGNAWNNIDSILFHENVGFGLKGNQTVNQDYEKAGFSHEKEAGTKDLNHSLNQ